MTRSAEEILESVEQGPRHPAGWQWRILAGTAILWSLFQLWVASPIPYQFGFGVFNNTETRSIHLGFAVFLVFLSFPWRAGARTDRVPVFDWALGLAASFCALYLFLFYEDLANRAGDPTRLDIGVAVAGILLLLEATRRALGWPLTIIALVFLGYTFAGPWLPDVMAHKGASLERVASHQWLGTEGVFGVAVGVSVGFVFLFVLFGSLLEQAGGGQYFIRVAYSLVGHLRGGPAKAGVLASGLTGMISGSSIANVVTTGTFTIPLMKKVGFPGFRAGAIEVAASTNGQLMPPVMGAAAFLMVEYLNISYLEVIKHALLPALLSYIALMYVVHLEAVKAGMQGHPRPYRPLRTKLLGWGLSFSGLTVFCFVAWLAVDWVTRLSGDYAFWTNGLLILGGYVGLMYLEARHPLPDQLDAEQLQGEYLLTPGQALRGGLHFLLPIVVLIWCLMLLRLSPATAVFYAILLLVVIVLTQRPLKRLFSGEPLAPAWRAGGRDLVIALRDGARNMIPIGVATATAGIVVGTVSLTGIGQMMGELIEILSFGSVPLMLILTAVICMILGMGLPTTANYIVVSTLMAPVIAQLAASHGLEIPLVAIHLFVFYFGILADDTPPVGLAAYAASGISGADPIQTGLQSFYYDLRTAILPFMFVFNTELLLIGIDSIPEFLLVLTSSLAAMLLFAAATQGWWLTRCRWWEIPLLLLVAFSLFRPGFWLDLMYPPSRTLPAVEFTQAAAQWPAGETFQLIVEVEDEPDQIVQRTLTFERPAGAAEQVLEELGLITTPEGASLRIENIGFLSPAEEMGLVPGFALRVLGFEEELPQPNKDWFLIPALLLAGLIGWGQLKRRRTDPGSGRRGPGRRTEGDR